MLWLHKPRMSCSRTKHCSDRDTLSMRADLLKSGPRKCLDGNMILYHRSMLGMRDNKELNRSTNKDLKRTQQFSLKSFFKRFLGTLMLPHVSIKTDICPFSINLHIHYKSQRKKLSQVRQHNWENTSKRWKVKWSIARKWHTISQWWVSKDHTE